MKQKLQEYALLAEIFSALAIVVSLIFVGIQIQQSSELSQINAYQSIRQSINSLNELVISNPEFASVVVRARYDEELLPSEQRQLQSFGFSLFNLGDMAYKQYESNLISEDELLEMLSPIGYWIGDLKYTNQQWRAMARDESGSLDRGFVAYVQENIIDSQ